MKRSGSLTISLFLFLSFPLANAQDFTAEIALVNIEEGKMTVDLTGHESYASLNSALASKMGLSQSPKWKPVPPELLPQKLKARDVQILTPQGNVMAKVEDARISYGASEVRLVLVTDHKATSPDFQGGIAKLGTPFPSSLRLELITGTAGSETSLGRLGKQFVGWVEKSFSKTQVEPYQCLEVTPNDRPALVRS